ncbi:unnamed protein product [Caenorhabditis auriculariae]|uniref:Uncharacterized protein n=1 Tax=Caenorhabditis auriculariae TaxID=2777116 RepID=A0A8S1GYT4_9PELO|nr:unnamed protein product [Caenorhabditis auriculariae]
MLPWASFSRRQPTQPPSSRRSVNAFRALCFAVALVAALAPPSREAAADVDTFIMNLVTLTSHLCTTTTETEENAEKCEQNATNCKESDQTKSKDSGRATEICKDPLNCTAKEGCSCSKTKEDNEKTSSEALYDVFLGGSCGTTVWRRQLVIPFLKRCSISYYDPQRSVWSENMIYEECIAKENSSLFLFVIDPATVNATSFLEIAYFAARKSPKLVVVFLGKTEWAEKAHPDDLPDRNRTCRLLDRILEAHAVPMLHNIQDALDFIEEEMLGRKTFKEAMNEKRNRIPYVMMKARQCSRKAKTKVCKAFTSCQSHMSRVAVAGFADAVALFFCQLLVPSVPLHFFLVPLIFINFVVFTISSKWKQMRRNHPRLVADSSSVHYSTTPAIPSPRLSTLTTSINGGTSNQSLKRRTKKNFEKMAPDQENNGFVVPRSFTQQRPLKVTNDCTTIELCSSSLSDNTWVQEIAAPLLDSNAISYSYALTMPLLLPEVRVNCFKMWQKHHKKFFYYISSSTTFLSGMVEVAYVLGHSNWQATVCVPSASQILDGPEECSDEEEMERLARRRRNDCYQIAFCYLKDMAKRRQCRIYTKIEDAVRSVVEQNVRGL